MHLALVRVKNGSYYGAESLGSATVAISLLIN
jgi:hypothetical protein